MCSKPQWPPQNMENDCKPAYEMVKTAVFDTTSISKTNLLVMAFDKCMIDNLNTNWNPIPNYNCGYKLTNFYYMCESELKETVINFIDMLLLINDSYDFKGLK